MLQKSGTYSRMRGALLNWVPASSASSCRHVPCVTGTYLQLCICACMHFTNVHLAYIEVQNVCDILWLAVACQNLRFMHQSLNQFLASGKHKRLHHETHYEKLGY